MYEPSSARDDADLGRDDRRPAFGPIDPYCWLAVAPFVVFAVLFVFGGSVPIALGCLAGGALVVLFDSWVNRPGPTTYRTESPVRARPAPPRQPMQRATRPPVRQPSRAPRQQPPGRPAPGDGRPPWMDRPMPGSGRPRSAPAAPPDSVW